MFPLRPRDDVAVLHCDGVVLDLARGFAQTAGDAIGRPWRALNGDRRPGVRCGLSPSQEQRVWDAMDDHPLGWSDLKPLPGAPQALAKLRQHGMRVHLVVDERTRLTPARLDGLLQHGLHFDDLVCVSAETGATAGAVMALAPAMYVADRLAWLHRAPFVPERVWVDRGEAQDGHVVDETLVRVTRLAQWVEQWALRHSAPARSRHLRLVSP